MRFDVDDELEILDIPFPRLPQHAGTVDQRVDPFGLRHDIGEVVGAGHIGLHEFNALGQDVFSVQAASDDAVAIGPEGECRLPGRCRCRRR